MADVPSSTPSNSQLTASQQVMSSSQSLNDASQRILSSENPQARDLFKARLLQQEAALLDTQTSMKYEAPAPIPLPPVRTLAQVPDPDDPIQLKLQLDMERALVHHGWSGLQQEVYRIALGEKCLDQKNHRSLGGDKSWDKLRRDATSGNNYVYHLLRTCPVKYLLSMIRNTLAYDSLHDKEIRDFIKQRLAWEGPAVYGNCTALGGNIISAGIIEPNRGRWLSKTQIEQLLAEVELYIADRPADQQRSVKIDKYFEFGWQNKPGRRYCPGDEVRAKFRVWIEAIKSQYCTGLDPSKDAIPSIRCPMEIGWASHVRTRLQAHKNNGSTTHIYGLVNVLTRMLFRFKSPKQFVIFPVWEPKDMPQIAELLATVLCSSYYYRGGLNHYHAGTFKDKVIEPKFRREWQLSAQFAIKPYKNSEEIDLVRGTTRQIQAGIADQLQAKKKEYEELQAELAQERLENLRLRESRVERRLETAEQVRKNISEPLRQELMHIAADADKHAEMKDWLAEKIDIPGLPEDPRFGNDIEEGRKRLWEIFRQKAPSVFFDDPVVESEAYLPRDLSRYRLDVTVGEDIEQVPDSKVQEYDSDREEEENDDDKEGEDDSDEGSGNAEVGDSSPANYQSSSAENLSAEE